MTTVFLQGQSHALDPTAIIGEGGEAVIYQLSAGGQSQALKLWKSPSHPDFKGNTAEARRIRAGVKLRLEELQDKIRTFPTGLPPRVITPGELATDQAGNKVLGYVMPLVKGADPLRNYTLRRFRDQGGIDGNQVIQLFQDLYRTVKGLHTRQVVIGDFNYLNVLVRNLEAYLIDSDSMQFANFPCRTYTARFVDPLICDPNGDKLVQIGNHSIETDWYAYALMLFEALLFVHPYGGIYQPKNGAPRIAQGARPLKRASVFGDNVVYPKAALPLETLPDELLHFYTQLIAEDQRSRFPGKLLDSLRWTTCSSCGNEHARPQCPHCATRVAPERITEVIRGNISLRRVFRTSGVILRAAFHGGKLRVLYHEDDQFRREDGAVILKGSLNPRVRYRIRGKDAVLASHGQWVIPGDTQGATPVDSYRDRIPMIATNEKALYWLQGGRLFRSGALGPKVLGQVLTEQTWFAVGPSFGFGFYRAGQIQTGFVFDAEHGRLNDSVSLPALRGELIDAHCYFTSQRAWCFLVLQDGGTTTYHCLVIDPNGVVKAHLETEESDEWFSTVHGKAAATFKTAHGPAHVLFAATPNGLLRLQEENGSVVVGADFPDTKGLIDPDDSLFFAKEGLYAANRREVRLMTMKRS